MQFETFMHSAASSTHLNIVHASVVIGTVHWAPVCCYGNHQMSAGARVSLSLVTCHLAMTGDRVSLQAVAVVVLDSGLIGLLPGSTC